MAGVSVNPQFVYTTVDVATDATSVYAGPCIVRAARVSVVLSAHVCPIYDGNAAATTLMGSFAASAAVGTTLEFYDVVFRNGIYVDPDNSGTGNLWICYAPI